MMEEITLTGGTLASDNQDHVELTSQQQQQQQHSHSHSHSHHQNDHSSSSSAAPCCNSSTPQIIPRMTVNMTELLQAPPQEIHKALSTLVRMGSYQAFDQVVQGLLEHGTAQDVLNRMGDDGHSLLHWAAKRVDDVHFLTLLCKHVSNSLLNAPSNDDTGMSPLHWACTEGSIPHVALLLRHGAALESRDNSGCTPLLIGSQYGQVHVVAYLLQKGADGTATDHARDSALHWAAYKGSLQVCGLLVFRRELDFGTADAYGQTPLHLASLRGHTSVVRYILEEEKKTSLSRQRQLLYAQDRNHKTPLDLAIQKKRPTVEVVLRHAMERLDWNQQRGVNNRIKLLRWNARQLLSVHAWKLWMGCQTLQDEEDESPKFPFYFIIFLFVAGFLWWPLLFLPIQNTSQGLLWDCMGLHLGCFVIQVCMWYTLYKTYTTDPGILDDASPHTPALRRLYEQTLESYSQEESFASRNNEMPLCHTCHIAKPLRSKHCRVARRCVLLFDHHCPFVGNTIGLYNYKWFYLCLLFITLSEVGFIITWSLYLHRSSNIPWDVLAGGIAMAFFILPSGGMLIYHTQLMIVNLTTNEHQNMSRYTYLQNEHGQYKNPFFRGSVRNILDRFAPSEASYTLNSGRGGGGGGGILREEQEEDDRRVLLQHQDIV